MKISNIFQLKEFGIFFVIGVIVGLIYGILNIMHITRIYPIRIVIDIIFSLIFTATYLITINIISNGIHRFFIITAYILGFALERISIGKMFAKGYKFMYTTLVRLTKKFYTSNLGKVIFK